MVTPIRIAALLLLVTAVGCHAVLGFTDFDVDEGTTGVGGAGTGGNGTGGGACDPVNCPGNDSACEYRACDSNGACTFENAAADTGCSEATHPTAKVCDGEGTCVECNDVTHCPDGDLCVQHLCVPQECVNGTQDSGETDVDCGGDVCPPCANGDTCQSPTDCESGYCDASTCAPCSTDSCDSGTWCDPSVDGGTCVDKLAAGDVCASGGQCVSGFCPADDGVCCDTACQATCNACLFSKSGSPNGTCALVPAGEAYDGECGVTAATTCGSTGDGCTGTSSSCILHDDQTECAPASCNGTVLTLARLCDGQGTCSSSGPTTDCAPYMCNGILGQCEAECSDHTECVTTFWCDYPTHDPGRCLSDKNPGMGASCDDDEECFGNVNCVNGYCCLGPCTQQCWSCQIPGREGECEMVPGGTDPDPDCPGGFCDGTGICMF